VIAIAAAASPAANGMAGAARTAAVEVVARGGDKSSRRAVGLFAAASARAKAAAVAERERRRAAYTLVHFFSPPLPRPSLPPSRAANICSEPGCVCTAANPPVGCSCKGHVHKKSSAVAGAFHRVGGGGGRHGARVRSV
jgi:hypothetical protein